MTNTFAGVLCLAFFNSSVPQGSVEFLLTQTPSCGMAQVYQGTVAFDCTKLGKERVALTARRRADGSSGAFEFREILRFDLSKAYGWRRAWNTNESARIVSLDEPLPAMVQRRFGVTKDESTSTILPETSSGRSYLTHTESSVVHRIKTRQKDRQQDGVVFLHAPHPVWPCTTVRYKLTSKTVDDAAFEIPKNTKDNKALQETSDSAPSAESEAPEG